MKKNCIPISKCIVCYNDNDNDLGRLCYTMSQDGGRSTPCVIPSKHVTLHPISYDKKSRNRTKTHLLELFSLLIY